MGIPSKISPLTGGDILPRGYIAAEFIQNTGGQIFKLDQTETKVTSYEIVFSFVGATYNYGAIFSNLISGDNALTTTRLVHVDESKGWLFFLRQPNSSNAYLVRNIGYDGERCFLKVDSTKAIFNNKEFSPSTPSTTSTNPNVIGVFANNSTTYNPTSSIFRVYHFTFYEGNFKSTDIVPVLSIYGEPCFYDMARKKVYNGSGSASAIIGMTVSQARYLRKLPIVASGALTVSLPWEAQYDTGVQNALSIAADRGWTITVQYRDPEVATTPMPISFLESTGTQRIDAGLRYSSNDTYSQTLDLSITDKNHAGNTGVNYLGWCSVKNGTYYMLNETPNAPIGERDIIYNKFLNKERFLYVNGSEVTRHAEQYAASDIIAGIFALGNVNSAWWWETDKNIKAKLYSAKFTKNDVLARDMLPALDSTGTPCLYDLITKQTFYNNGTGAFIAGFNTIEQSMKLATLPDVTAETDVAKKSLTVSLPWEAQLIASGVPAALQVAADRGWTITVQYRDPEADNVYYNKYATCTTVNDMKAVNPNYKTDLTAAGEWIYPLPLISNARDMLCENRGLTAVSTDMSMCPNAVYAFAYCPNLKSFSGSLLSLQNGAQMINNSRQFKYFDASVPALSNGQLMFNYCILDKGSALNVLNSIPTYTSGSHLLTIGIHIDYQNDEEVLTAITNAEAKGWTVTVQWNGTATAAAASVSTFGLRSPAIYAKLGTVERPDGTTENVLDWGHYVSDWEENGYQEFSSIEEAEAHFNINQTE